MRLSRNSVLKLTRCGRPIRRRVRSGPMLALAVVMFSPALLLAPEAEAKTKAPKVDWVNYAPTVKTRIKALAQARDCVGLQREFDAASANDNAQRRRVGQGNADLMSYIDFKMRKRGCHN
jgi:hypothetical protein